LIVSVTAESARIESTSWAKVRRSISAEPAGAAIGTKISRRPAATDLRNSPIRRVGLGQRRKVFRNLRAIREYSRQQSGERAEENHADQNCKLE
jgi:hypothetical protein